MRERPAPGWPGSPGRWTSANKCGIGTALGGSAIWFTLSHGILNEIYAPRMDQAATRDLGLVVTAPGGFFSEEKRHAVHEATCPVPGVPHYRLANACVRGRYRIDKDVIADPRRTVVLQRIRFTPLVGRLEDYRLFALLAPHLENHGAGNTGMVGAYKGVPALFASRGSHALCLLSTTGFRARSAGFVGTSDGWQDLLRHGELRDRWTLAENGNVALCGELDIRPGEMVLALGHGSTPEEAAHQARASLAEPFDAILEAYTSPWKAWQRTLRPARKGSLVATSAMLVKAHQSKHLPGAIVASLAVPWGFAKGDGDLGGYHLVWPRDMVEAAGGLLAAGAKEEVRAALGYLQATQEADGHWPQNMWADGRPYWVGIQMDETALPILLVDLARRQGALQDRDVSVRALWPMVRQAAAFLVRNGPVTQQDRWEEDGGYTPFTLAAEIAALLAAAELAEIAGEGELAPYLRETADGWNDRVESWTYVRGTDLARRSGVDGYYVRIAPAGREAGASSRRLEGIVSADALALVRFGLRAPGDPRIRNTVRVIDSVLRVETPNGPSWHRYNGDGYGEHEDGSPFDGAGIGRAWPLLTGERGHYAVACGDPGEAESLLATMEALAGPGGVLPEQTWDVADVPERELHRGGPTGSAMPLVWAHAEHLKLARSLADGVVFDTPPQPVERYVNRHTASIHAPWRFNQKVGEMERGRTLRVETLAPAVVHWSSDSWRTVVDSPTRDTGLGLHVADLPTRELGEGARIDFTFFWPGAGRWEGKDFSVTTVGGLAMKGSRT